MGVASPQTAVTLVLASLLWPWDLAAPESPSPPLGSQRLIWARTEGLRLTWDL